MSNIEKIKAEIERLKQMGSIGLNEYDAGFENGRGELCDELLAFIDSLPEETCKDSLQVQETCKENPDSFTDEPKKMSVDEAMKYIDEKIAKTRASKSWELVDIDKFMDEIRGRELDDLEDFDSMPEEIPPYVTGFKGEPDPLGICDLEKAAGRCGFDYVDNIVQETPEHRWNDHDVEFGYRDGFIAGAKWMKSQMPLPEDTVIFMKGVAEGRRLEREDRNNDKLPRFYGD